MQLTPTKWNVTVAFYGVRMYGLQKIKPIICMETARIVQTIVNSILTVPSQKEVSLLQIPDYLGFFWIVYTLMKIGVHFPNPPKQDLSFYTRSYQGKKLGNFGKCTLYCTPNPEKWPDAVHFPGLLIRHE